MHRWFKVIKNLKVNSACKFWQRNYFEHIIRNEDELNKIRKYIIENPLKWNEDEYNPYYICRGNPRGYPE
jgi:putative transposase